MGHIGMLEPETHWSNKSFVLWRLSCEILSDKTDLVDSSFPAFSLSLSGSDDFKHLGFSHWLDLLNRD